MRFKTLPLWLAMGAATSLTGCMAAETRTSEAATSYVGWYMEHAGQGMFRSCGQAEQLRITASSDLPARAKAFGLQPDTPVYVRLIGSERGGGIAVSRVEQFGSPTPVRNCGMNGVVIPAPSSSGG